MRFKFIIGGKLKRFGRAWRYATGHWNANDASYIAYECHQITDCWPLEYVDAEGVLNYAEALWSNDRAELEPLAKAAVARVASKWSGNGDLTGAAEDWAIELIGEYAAHDGIALLGRDAEAA